MGLMEVIVGDDHVIWRVIREVMIQLNVSVHLVPRFILCPINTI
jgi:hypothetical protein